MSLLTKLLVDTTDDHCITRPWTLRYHILDIIVENLSRAGLFFVLYASSHEHCSKCLKTSYCRTSRPVVTRMEEAVHGLLICTESDQMCWKSTQAVNSTETWNLLDPYSRLLVEEHHTVRNGEYLALQITQANIYRVHKMDTKKAALFSHLLDLLNEDTVSTFLFFLLRLLMHIC